MLDEAARVPPSARTKARRPSRPQQPANDDASIASTTSLAFTATADGSAVALMPFYDAHGVNDNVHWNTSGSTGGTNQ